jgi:aromatic ring-cleaving dioxygenase
MFITTPPPGRSPSGCVTRSSASSLSSPEPSPIGPHPISQFNVIFETEEFQRIVPWLMLNHEGLDVLIHPLTESSYDDHSKNALWIGTPVPMRLESLRRTLTYSADLLPTGLGHPA